MSAGVVEGNAPRFTVTFTNDEGVKVDPDEVTFLVEQPDASVTAYVYGTDAEVVKDETGVYYIDITLDVGQFWFWRWEGAGTTFAACQGDLYVIPARPVVVAP